MSHVKRDRVYYAKLFIFNSSKGKTDKVVELGDPNITNQDSGLDAYASGDGGNGGKGGTLRFINTDLPRQQAILEGGAPGTSDLLPAEPLRRHSVMLHMNFGIVHKGWASNRVASERVARQLHSEPGRSAQGKSGRTRGGAAGRGTRALRGGCIAPALSPSSAFNCAARV